MTKTFLLPLLFILCAATPLFANKYDIAAFVWPAYQAEPRWKELGIFSHGTGEWQSVYEAVAKTEGHKQPKIPLWGYERDDDPIAVARQIDAALAAGINVFIYDWYWYKGRPFLENALNNGFLKAPNNGRMKFFIMWANHHVNNYWDNTKSKKSTPQPIWDGRISLDEFKSIAKRSLDMYFKKPNYYTIDGKPVYGIYELDTFVDGVGGAEKAKEAIEYLREICRDAGFKGAHVMVIARFPDTIKGGIPNVKNPTVKDIAAYLGIDSFTTYNWVHISGDKGEYKDWAEKSLNAFDTLSEKVGIPYFANVSVGWDNNARFPKDFLSPMVVNSNPDDYANALEKALKWADSHNPQLPKLITVNSWNEWTEGSYLMPDTDFGYGYLNATRKVLDKHKADCQKQ